MATTSPEEWFLSKGELVRMTLRESGSETYIPQSQLLERRFLEWTQRNQSGLNSSYKWGLADPDQHLTKAYTSNNEVIPLVHGDAYMRSLYEQFTKSPPINFVLIAGWEFSTDRWLVPEQKLASLLSNLIYDAQQTNGTTTRLLAFQNPIPGINNGKLVDLINNLYPSTDNPEQRVAFLDGDLGGFAMSHHQKEVFVGRADFEQCYSYVGGIDLAVDRWDTPQHDKTAAENRFYGWHDIQVRVRGDANTQIWANFAERWDSADQKISRIPGKKKDYRLKPCPIPTWKPDTAPGSLHVQVLRTVAPAPSSYRSRFMPEGERTVLCALRKAIQNAECYIYIEEQFLWDCELADVIAAQMQKNKDLVLIVVMAAQAELPIHWGQYQYHLRSVFFQTVMGLDAKSDIAFGKSTRVYAYGLYQTPPQKNPIYVHSKLMIVDDRYVAVGSANVVARSMHIETELTLGIVDATTVESTLNGKQATVCEFARTLRETLWKEHLGVTSLSGSGDPTDALKDFPGTTFAWPANQREAKEQQKGHARPYINRPGNIRLLTPGLQRIVDRNVRRWRRV